MKKSVLIILIFTASLSLVCSHNLKDGWIDDNSFAVTGQGILKAEQKDKAETIKQKLVCESARLNAIHRAAEQFASVENDTIKGKLEIKRAAEIIYKVYSLNITDASIEKSLYYPESEKCAVRIIIKGKNLKKEIKKLLAAEAERR